MPAKNQNPKNGTFRLADFLPYKLAVANASLSRVFIEGYGKSYNLTIPEWRTLAVIAEHGTLTPTAVGQNTAMDKVKVSRAVQTLIAKGLVRQSPDPSDGRGRLLRLTRKGSALHARMVPLIHKMEARMFDEVSSSDKATLNRVLNKISSRLEAGDECDPDGAD
jgi:DNA-binding MarR family transcriptional regulator